MTSGEMSPGNGPIIVACRIHLLAHLSTQSHVSLMMHGDVSHLSIDTPSPLFNALLRVCLLLKT